MSVAPHEAGKVRRVRRKESVILFTIADQLFAIAASAVHEIRSADSLGGSASDLEQTSVAKVKHILQRGNRTYFVVDGGAHFGLRQTRPTLVLILRDSPAAVLVDKIERMVEISGPHALPLAFDGEERRWYRGLAYLDDHVLPVVNPAGFLERDEVLALERAAEAALAAQPAMQGTAS
ncbi:MAG: chemotaxis protein CheW [Candidatus Acidiferrales bacterium]